MMCVNLPSGIAERPTRHARVFLIALRSTWLEMRTRSEFISTLGNGVPRFAVLAWIAGQSEDSSVVATVSVGIVLLVIWTAAAFRVSFTLRNEAFLGTLDLNMLARSPLALITLGKAAAVTLSFVPNAIAALIVVFAVTRQPITVAALPAFAVAMTLAILALLAVAFVLLPMLFIIGNRAGSFAAITPFGAVLSGFVYPIDVLPGALEVVARLMPTSWAMETVRWSIFGGHDASDFAGHWGIAAALTALYVAISVWLFRVAETRIRRSGSVEGGF